MAKPTSIQIHTEPTEQSPLLTPSTERGEIFELRSKRPSWQTPQNIGRLLLALIIISSFGQQLQESPQARINESVICYRYYERVDPDRLLLGRDQVGPGAIGGVAEMWCKADEVQSELAMLNGWQQLFDGLPSLLLAIPYGWAADRFGRKPVLASGIFGIMGSVIWIKLVTWFWQAFDIRITWFSTLFCIAGGGEAVVTAMFFTTVSDITPEAERGAAFLRIGAFNLIANLIMPPVAAWLMTINPWIPNLLGLALLISTWILYLFIPETVHMRKDPPTTPITPTIAPTATSLPLSLASMRHHLTLLRQATSFLTSDWRVPALMVPFLSHILLGAAGQLTLQYLSKRYSLTFSQATLLMTIRSAVVVVLLFAIIPYISRTLRHKFRLSNQRTDLYLARGSQVLVAAGWTLVGLAPTIPFAAGSLAIASLGQGAMLLLRSFLTALIPAHQIARAYSFVGVIDTLGAMFGAPLLAGLFRRGLALSGFWAGLPFYFIGIVSAGFAVVMFIVGLRKGDDEHFVAVGEDGQVEVEM